ncbi:MAG: glycosyltransferase family 4 protein [Clostridia bacterium]|nr:glycosyltransferase family 4 protein [Clostridia bacterium]
MKVLYLLNHAGKAGTERYVYSLIEKLNKKKINAYFAYNEEGLLVEQVKEIGIETFRIEMKHPLDIAAAWKLNKLCKQLGIDLIHTQYLRENYIALLSRFFNPKVKVMYTSHFIMANNFVLRVFNRILTRLEANIISVCNKGKQMLMSNGLDGKKIKVIFNGVDPNFWGDPIESTMRKEFGIDEDAFVFLCGSRFAYDKGHKFLIQSVAELKKTTDKKFKCVLANDGPLLEECKQLVKDLDLEGDIIFTGFRKDIKNLIAGSDLYINSSEHEALSFAIIEVLASGLPVIATDMGGNDDIINAETNCGILVQYNDAKGLAASIQKIMGNKELQKNLRKNALKAIQERFNLDKMVEETYNLYVDSVTNK